jgi:hypothetical protein
MPHHHEFDQLEQHHRRQKYLDRPHLVSSSASRISQAARTGYRQGLYVTVPGTALESPEVNTLVGKAEAG